MPRLSIIIPHRDNSLRMEETLVSVLENRPKNCEILVAHNGSYRDPYDLSSEVVFVQAEPHSNLLHLINEATFASCAPVVNVIMDGVLVTKGWAETPLACFDNQQIGSVVPHILGPGQQARRIAGINLNSSMRKQLNPARKSSATRSSEGLGPLLACGFYRRKALLALGGWCPQLEPQVADVDMAQALSHLELLSVVEPTSQVCANLEMVESELSFLAQKQLATILLAYQRVKADWPASLLHSMHQIIRGGFLPKQWLAAIAGWQGLHDRATVTCLRRRLQAAQQELESRLQPTAETLQLPARHRATPGSAASQSQGRKAA